jgi:hypothetical protein
MSPFEVLYGRKCTIPITWENPMENLTLGPELLKEMEQAMIRIKQNLKISQDRQKRYPDNKRTHKEFKVGDHAYLGVK